MFLSRHLLQIIYYPLASSCRSNVPAYGVDADQLVDGPVDRQQGQFEGIQRG